jgi:hypothetical protein
VIDLFEQINSEDPNFPDPEGRFVSSRDALGLEQRVATLYDLGQQYISAGEWQQALECFGEVERLKSNCRETKALLEQARQQDTADTKSPSPYCCQTTNTDGLRLRTMLDGNGDRRVELTRV